MPRIPTSEEDARRDWAFDLYRAGVSLRQIGRTEWVTLSTVQWWRKADGWDARAAALAPKDSAAIRDLLREGLYEGLECLNEIITDHTGDAEARIQAIKAFAKIVKDFGVIHALDLAKTPDAVAWDFKDDLFADVIAHGLPEARCPQRRRRPAETVARGP